MRIDIDIIQRHKKNGKILNKVFPLYREEIKSMIFYHYNDGELKNATSYDDIKDAFHFTIMIDKTKGG